ncbi:hypothetical protein D3C80_1707620 [compost metagenome]
MRIDFVGVESEKLLGTSAAFGPQVVDLLEEHYGVRKNQMFISCPSEMFRYKVADLNGVRIITSD